MRSATPEGHGALKRAKRYPPRGCEAQSPKGMRSAIEPLGAPFLATVMPPDPNHTAFLFPGQGSQKVGMGKDLAAADASARAVFAEADEILGYSLSRLCWDGPAEELNDTAVTQPALLTHSVAVLRALEARQPGLAPAVVAGHSLGEFSALVAAGALDFAPALRLVQQRGRLMKEAGQRNPGGMAAVLGLDVEQIDAICRAVEAERGGGGRGESGRSAWPSVSPPIRR